MATGPVTCLVLLVSASSLLFRQNSVSNISRRRSAEKQSGRCSLNYSYELLLVFLNILSRSLSKPASGPGESQGSLALGCSRLRLLKQSLKWLMHHEVSCCGAVIFVFQFVEGIGLDLLIFAMS